MTELKHEPLTHDHSQFLAKASERKGFQEAYDALKLEYKVTKKMLNARARVTGKWADSVDRCDGIGASASVV